jgi:DNA repair exonuclease SbcCD ATPase subunit
VKIVSLQANNILRLNAVYIEPSGNMVEITGQNDAGKSSVLNSVFIGLVGKDEYEDPIHDGAEEAVIHLDLGDVKVKRRYWRKEDGSLGHSVVVELGEGFKHGKPQTYLNEIIGRIAFDPLAFTRMKAKEQYDHLKAFVPGYDFDAEAEKRKRLFTTRTDVNRLADQLETQALGITVPEDAPEAEVDVSALVAELEAAGQTNADIEKRAANRTAAAERVTNWTTAAQAARDRAAELRRQAEEQDAEAERLTTFASDQQKQIDAAPALPAKVETTEVRARIAEAQAANDRYQAAARAKAQKADIEQKAKAQRGRSAELTKQIEAIDAAKMEAIAGAKMPVEGLSFGDEVVLLNGHPFNQASKAQQLRAGIAIAAAMNPKLRVARVMDGSLLDRQSWEILAKFATEKDLQVWVETVESDRPGAIVIEDGGVKEILPYPDAAE